MKISFIFPVYNEEKRVENGITTAVNYLSKYNDIDSELIIVDNASTDKTKDICDQLTKKYNNVRYLRIEKKGVGIAVKEGASIAVGDIVGYMDIDLSTDINHVDEMINYFKSNQSIQVVNGSRFNINAQVTKKKWYRHISSYGFIFILKARLNMKASDAVCGFKFFRKEILLDLINESTDENGWFFIVELLLRAERNGINIVEIPVRWEDDANHSSVKVVSQTIEYIRQIERLRRDLKKIQ